MEAGCSSIPATTRTRRLTEMVSPRPELSDTHL
jgi:hypothetical protein